MTKTKTITVLLMVNALETICNSERGKETDSSSNNGLIHTRDIEFFFSSLNENIPLFQSLRKLNSNDNKCEYNSDKFISVPINNKIKNNDDY